MTPYVTAATAKTELGPDISICVGQSGAIVAAGFTSVTSLLARNGLTWTDGDIGAAGDALDAYAAGDLSAWDNVEYELVGTDFQVLVWQAIAQIPLGLTATYGEIAAAVGRPRAVRAVGTACGANRVAPMVPCHRVLPACGGVGSYGYGPQVKSDLLTAEARLRDRTPVTV